MDDAREQLDALRTEIETELARAELTAIRDLHESDPWGFPDEESDYSANNSPSIRTALSAGVGRAALHRPFSSVWDRSGGRHLPLFEAPQDLALMRARCRSLAAYDSLFLGAQQALNVYVIGGDWSYTIEPHEGLNVPDPLVRACQRIVDRFLDDNEWQGSLDSDIHDGTREDGDGVLALHPRPNGRARAHWLNADRCEEPDDVRSLNDWLDIDAEWNFGVQAAYCPDLKDYDYTHPAGYHIVNDDTGSQWDYLPRWPMPQLENTRCGTMYKRNTPRAAARGWSDYAPIVDDIEGAFKLRRGTRVGATVMSHIAYILENAPGVGRGQAVDGSGGNTTAALIERLKGSRNAPSVPRKHLPPGSYLSTNSGQKYHAGPMGSSHAPVFMEVAQFGIRMISVRWLMPEYMISGDASNANYASTVQSASPFTKAREKEQSEFVRFVRRVLMKVLRMAYVSGALDQHVGSWAELLGLVDLSITPPQVSSDDKLKEVQRNSALFDRGILAADDWAAMEGLDPEKVREVAAPDVRSTGTPGGFGVSSTSGPALIDPEAATPSGEFAGLSRLQWQRNRKAIDDVLGDHIAGTTTEVRARALLSGLGLTRETVDALIADAADGKVDSGPPVTESQRFELAQRLLFADYP